MSSGAVVVSIFVCLIKSGIFLIVQVAVTIVMCLSAVSDMTKLTMKESVQ